MASQNKRSIEDVKYMRALEDEYWKSLDAVGYKIARHQTVGLQAFLDGRLEDALKEYDAALELGPARHLWHRGLVLFYLGRYADASAQLRRDAALFEEQFGESGTEERIWARAADAFAATAAAAGDAAAVAAAAAALGPAPPLALREDGALKAALHALFCEGTGAALDRVEALAPRHGVGDDAALPPPDPAGRAFLIDFYMALWHESQGRTAAARARMARAALSPYPQPGDLWAALPALHMRLHGWDAEDVADDAAA